MTLTTLCGYDSVGFFVGMSGSFGMTMTMAMAMFVEKKETKDIGEKAKTSDNEYEPRIGDSLRFDEALNSV